MTFRKYTQCYQYTPGLSSRPFNEKDLPGEVIVHLTLALTLMGSAVIIGLAAGGPIGAIIGAVVGFVTGITTGVATAIHDVADQWLNHRLVCLGGGPKCAVGTVTKGPERSDLGAFDNDQYFDVVLMPHRIADNYNTLTDPAAPNAQPMRYGTVADPTHMDFIRSHPANEIYVDDFQGQWYLRPNPTLFELGYNNENKSAEELHTASMLHCEAEGDFWVRMRRLSVVFGWLTTALVAATAGGVAAGITAGISAGCAIGGLFGRIGCLIGAIIGAIIGALAGAGVVGAVGAAIMYGILQAVFHADPGDVEDANVGDKALGDIGDGSRVAVLGEHVYDGFHQGWHEFHPLMAVLKVEPDRAQPSAVVTWDPKFGDQTTPPGGLDRDDMKQGLNSGKLAEYVHTLHDTWCTLLRAAFDDTTRQAQQHLSQRWTIHTEVDGCASPPPPIG